MLTKLRKKKTDPYAERVQQPLRQLVSTMLSEALQGGATALGFGYREQLAGASHAQAQKEHAETGVKTATEQAPAIYPDAPQGEQLGLPHGPQGTNGMPVWYEYPAGRTVCRDAIPAAAWVYVLQGIAETVVAAEAGGPKRFLEYARDRDTIRLAEVDLHFDSHNVFWIKILGTREVSAQNWSSAL